MDSLQAYLQERGVLAQGTPEEIAAAKRDYRKLYDRGYKAKYRRAHVEIRFTIGNDLVAALDTAAAKEGIDRTAFARDTLIARIRGDQASRSRLSRELLQQVTMIYTEVRHLCRHHPTGFIERRILFDRLSERVGALEDALWEATQP